MGTLPGFAVLVGAALLLTQVATAQTTSTGSGQGYPTRAIRLVVHSSPGGSSDILGRLIAQRLTESLGQQVVV
ncbi:MAG TPA: hypothetical protein VJQ51_04345 [Burkholderiales bacterium]|nr:hypothetical protein [Burkholderiales bacterium]